MPSFLLSGNHAARDKQKPGDCQMHVPRPYLGHLESVPRPGTGMWLLTGPLLTSPETRWSWPPSGFGIFLRDSPFFLQGCLFPQQPHKRFLAGASSSPGKNLGRLNSQREEREVLHCTEGTVFSPPVAGPGSPSPSAAQVTASSPFILSRAAWFDIAGTNFSWSHNKVPGSRHLERRKGGGRAGGRREEARRGEKGRREGGKRVGGTTGQWTKRTYPEKDPGYLQGLLREWGLLTIPPISHAFPQPALRPALLLASHTYPSGPLSACGPSAWVCQHYRTSPYRHKHDLTKCSVSL
jgi:hypothetical protein